MATITAMNCIETGNVMSQGEGANRDPTNAVLVKFTFITVIIKAWLAPIRQTLPETPVNIFINLVSLGGYIRC